MIRTLDCMTAALIRAQCWLMAEKHCCRQGRAGAGANVRAVTAFLGTGAVAAAAGQLHMVTLSPAGPAWQRHPRRLPCCW